jgi:hypothetical protein
MAYTSTVIEPLEFVRTPDATQSSPFGLLALNATIPCVVATEAPPPIR